MRTAPARLHLRPSFLLLLALLALSLVSREAAAATGDVMSFVKQSDIAGQFTPVMANGDELGGTAIGLGDLDGPGPSTYAVAVGSALNDTLATVADKGAVYICFLSASGTILSTTKIGATSGGLVGPIDIADEFGTSVAFLGDLDGNGPSVAAIAVGAPGDDDGAGNAGAVYILFLSSSGTVMSQQKISKLSGGLTATIDAGDELGGALAWLGQMDNKSAGVLAVGAAGDDDGGIDRGAVHLLFLNRNGTVQANRKISSTAGGFTGTLTAVGDFGGALANLQDLDGPGPSKRALAIGGSLDDDGGADRGSFWITFLSDTGLVLSSVKISSLTPAMAGVLDNGDEFGGSLENLGDMDGPGAGVTTLAVSATGDDDSNPAGGFDRGAVYLIHLTSTGAIAGRTKISNTSGTFGATLHDFDNFGSAIAYLGDLDGAGPSGVAILVGASGDDDGGSDRGAFYICFLSSPVTADAPRDHSPAKTILEAANPNPFRTTTTIPFSLAGEQGVQLEILDVTGRLVRRFDASGVRSLVWDGRDDAGQTVPGGMYFLRLAKSGTAISRTTRAVLIR